MIRRQRLSYGCYYLCIHPDWQKRLRDEVRSNVPQKFFTSPSDDFSGGSVLDTLPILNAVCSETLRFLPTTPVTARTAAHDTTILSTSVPKGTKIIISPLAMNRLEDFYGPTAEIFDPARWLDKDGKENNHGGATSNYAFSTFLHGPRKCLGMAYAKAEIRAFVAAFVGRFEFKMADGEEVVQQAGMFSTRLKDGLRLRMKVVEGWWSEG